MGFLEKLLESQRKHFEKGGKLEKFYPLFEAKETFLFTPSTTTSGRVHVRDAINLKRVMIIVVVALLPTIFFGSWNVGYQHFLAQGQSTGLAENILYGLKQICPIIFVSYAVGGIWEVIFAVIRKHEINEGFLVTGILFPLTLPPTMPLWMVAVSISFGVVIGKEVFGGTGMNVLNPALTARAFAFFAYPAAMSGDSIWIALQNVGDKVVDGFSGATALGVAASAPRGNPVTQALQASGFSLEKLFYGVVPGSIGETSTLCCLIGAAILILTGIGRWRIMVACVLGVYIGATLMNFVASPSLPAIYGLPFQWHLVLGGFAFGAVFMATDPVSAAATAMGQWIYGTLIGILVVLIRVANPAYPEGMMLAILFMNVFAPTIDHFIVKAHAKRRLVRA